MTIGYSFMVEVLAALRARPRTAKQLAVALGGACKVMALRKLLRQLLDGRAIYIARWRGTKNAERVYALGDFESAPPPAVSRLNGSPAKPWVMRPAPAPMLFATRFCRLWDALTIGSSALDLVEESGMTLGSVRLVLRDMTARTLVRVAGYERHPAGPATALYSRKTKKRVAKPAPRTDHERYLRAIKGTQARELHRVFTFAAAPPPSRIVRSFAN